MALSLGFGEGVGAALLPLVIDCLAIDVEAPDQDATQMNESPSTKTTSPLEAVNTLTKALKKDATWEDLIRKIADKRFSEANIAAVEREPRNAQRIIAERIGTVTSVIVVAFNTITSLISLVEEEAGFHIDLVPALLGALEYLFYAVIAYLLTMIIVEWVLAARQVGAWRHCAARRFPSINGDTWLFVVTTVLALGCFATSYLYGFGKPALIAGWILLVFVLVALQSWTQPPRLVFIGPIRQDDLVVHARAERRFWPLGVTSLLSTGLQGELGGLSWQSQHKFQSLEKLAQFSATVARTTRIVVVSAHSDAVTDELLTETLVAGSADTQYLVTVDGDKQDAANALVARIQAQGAAVEAVNDSTLLEELATRLSQPQTPPHTPSSHRDNVGDG